MKKSLCFMLCVFVFFGSSCSDVKEHPLSYIYEDFSTPYVLNEEMTSENVSVDNVTSANELITQELDIHDFVQTHVFPSTYLRAYVDVNEMSLDYGVECLRKTQAGALYSVHRVKQGGWLYVFYHTYNPDLLRSQINHWFYVTEWLSFEDFSSLKKGKSTIEDAIAICDSIQIAKNIYVSSKEDSWWENVDDNQVFYKIYLKDGISTLTFKIQGDSLIFMDIVHDSNFDLQDFSLSRSYPYDARLLDSDFL